MKIGITGARGTVGRPAVQLAAKAGHQTVQIDRTNTEYDGTPNSEMRTADTANDYEATLKAFKGCDAIIHLDAIPNPVDKPDSNVHANNVNSAVNAIGLAYATQPLRFDYFPIDEEVTPEPTDSYALAKSEAETQAKAFVDWFPGTKIACMRIHEVAPRADVKKEHDQDWDNAGVKQLWGWVHPNAVGRACLQAVENAGNLKGCEVFNVHAPTTAQDSSSEDLAKKYYPKVPVKGDLSGNKAFWTTEKIQKVLGWEHFERE